MTRTIAILGIIACWIIASGYYGWQSYQSLVVRGEPLFPYLHHQAKAKAAAKSEFREFCIGKVVYIQFDNAVVTKLKPDGKVWTCGGA
jgi:hypothetical protein